MEKCTDTVVNWMIRCNAINEADKELYKTLQVCII